MTKIKKDKNGKMIYACLFCDDFIDSGAIDCSLLNKKFESYSSTGVSLEDCPLDDYYDPNQKIKIFVHVGDTSHLIEEGMKCFPTKLGEHPRVTQKEFYNYILNEKSKFTELNYCNINVVGNEMTVNMLGHMVAEGFPIEPQIIILEKSGHSKIATYDKQGYLINWTFGYFSWDSQLLHIVGFSENNHIRDGDIWY